MRAARCDVYVETGAKWVKAVQVMTDGAPVRADEIVVGQRVFLEGYPLPVAKVTRLNQYEIQLKFGQGRYGDPVVIAGPDDEFTTAVPAVIVDAIAAFRLTAEPYPSQPIWPPVDPEPIPIPVEIAGDGLTVTMTIDAEVSSTWDTIAGSYSWDLFVQTAEWDWSRILEGTFVVMAGDAR